MRYLWLTWIDPIPEHDGQRIYSGRLIEAVAAAGAEIEVLCFASPGSRRSPGDRQAGATWWPVRQRRRPGWASILSPLPNIVYRCDTQEKRKALTGLLAHRTWDAVVLDGLYAGWALPLLERLSDADGRQPRVIYISHNHEESVRAGIAADHRGNPIARYGLQRDAAKVRRVEHQLVERADLLTAITPEDAALFRSQRADKPILVLPPGYSGNRVERRQITADLPRRVVMVGSFGWLAKRMNLEAFVAAADPLFAQAGAELKIVGAAEPTFLDSLRRRTRATQFTGSVPTIEPHLADARIAIVPERNGGGFKLKVLDYVFNRLPVAALQGSVAGTPLQPAKDLLLYPDFDALARGTLAVLDDMDLLNRLQNHAFDACRNAFDWPCRGRDFLAGTAAL